jgi:hypothetical protein
LIALVIGAIGAIGAIGIPLSAHALALGAASNTAHAGAPCLPNNQRGSR